MKHRHLSVSGVRHETTVRDQTQTVTVSLSVLLGVASTQHPVPKARAARARASDTRWRRVTVMRRARTAGVVQLRFADFADGHKACGIGGMHDAQIR